MTRAAIGARHVQEIASWASPVTRAVADAILGIAASMLAAVTRALGNRAIWKDKRIVASAKSGCLHTDAMTAAVFVARHITEIAFQSFIRIVTCAYTS